MTELLSPAGSFKCLRAAVGAGADAVYFAGKRFGARAGAENIEDASIEEAIDFCRCRGVKTYAAVNAAVKRDELTDSLKFVERLYLMGADAVIISDLGLAALVRRHFPDLPMHASTQTTARSVGDAEFLRRLGFSRVILARELSAPAISDITAKSGIETEVFIHGALCFCYSGKCLASAFIGGRSGNRGGCAQPCRKIYTLTENGKPIKTGFLMSPKDLRGANFVNRLKDMGVAALKIEGRMKSPEYVYQTAYFYKSLLNGEQPTERDFRDLEHIFGRGGFTDGYFANRSGAFMTTVASSGHTGAPVGRVTVFDDVAVKCSFRADAALTAGDGILVGQSGIGTYVNKNAQAGDIVTFSPKDGAFGAKRADIRVNDIVYRTFDKILSDRLKRAVEGDGRKMGVTLQCLAKQGQPLAVTATHGDISATAYGEVAQKAEKTPVSAERLRESIGKTGSTVFNAENMEICADDNIFISLSAVNDTRRRALDDLREKIILSGKRKIDKNVEITFKEQSRAIPIKGKKWTVSVLTEEQFNAALEFDGIHRIYAPPVLVERLRKSGADVEIFAVLPFESLGKEYISDLDADGFLASSFAQLAALRRLGKRAAADCGFNVFNGFSAAVLSKFAETVFLSPELSFDEINAFASAKSEITIYGKTRVMTTRLCPVGLYGADKQNGKFCELRGSEEHFALKDETGAAFPVLTDCNECLARVYNDRPVLMTNKFRDINGTACGFLNLNFTDETGGQTREIIDAYSSETPIFMEKFTYGRFYAGVE